MVLLCIYSIPLSVYEIPVYSLIIGLYPLMLLVVAPHKLRCAGHPFSASANGFRISRERRPCRLRPSRIGCLLTCTQTMRVHLGLTTLRLIQANREVIQHCIVFWSWQWNSAAEPKMRKEHLSHSQGDD